MDRGNQKKNAWTKFIAEQGKLKAEVSRMLEANTQHKKVALESANEMSRLNKELYVVAAQVEFQSSDLGLSKERHMTDEDKMGKVTLGIEKLLDFHFSGEKGRSPNKRAKILG